MFVGDLHIVIDLLQILTFWGIFMQIWGILISIFSMFFFLFFLLEDCWIFPTVILPIFHAGWNADADSLLWCCHTHTHTYKQTHTQTNPPDSSHYSAEFIHRFILDSFPGFLCIDSLDDLYVLLQLYIYIYNVYNILKCYWVSIYLFIFFLLSRQACHLRCQIYRIELVIDDWKSAR